MAYLLIALVLAIILSPLMGLRQSPRQKLVAALRGCAKQHGLQVKLSQPAGARPGEGRLDTVIYRLPWATDSKPSGLRRAEQWLLLHESKRGDQSPWNKWRWMTLPVTDELLPEIGKVVEQLGETFSALEASQDGLSVYWQEYGEETDVEQLAQALTELQKTIRR